MRLTNRPARRRIRLNQNLTTPKPEFDAMRTNCAYCGELIEEDPVRWGSLYFCSPECYQDYRDRESEEHDEEEHRERDRT